MRRVPGWLIAAALLACSSDEGAGPETPGAEAIDIVQSCAIPPAPGASAVNVATDVTFATMNGQSLALDVAWPKSGGGPFPLIILLHGGAWSDGDKSTHLGDIRLLASLGYVAASPNYRLVPRDIFPAAVEDARCALRWLRSRAGDYEIDPQRAVAMGYSAGGHLAAMLGSAPNVAGLDGACPLTTQSTRVDGVIALYAPLDLRSTSGLTPFHVQVISAFLGGTPSAVPDKAALASPVAHATADDPPFLMVHGSGDFVVPIESSRRMRDALHDVGARATVVELSGVGHGFPAFAANLPPSTCTTLAFLDATLRP